MAAASLLERAVSLLPSHDGDRIDALITLAFTRKDLGDINAGIRVATEAASLAEEAQDAGLRWRAKLAAAILHGYQQHPGWVGHSQALAEEAIAALDALGDQRGLAQAWDLVGSVRVWSGQYAEWAKACERVVEHARGAGDVQLEARGLASLSTTLSLGPRPSRRHFGAARRSTPSRATPDSGYCTTSRRWRHGGETFSAPGPSLQKRRPACGSSEMSTHWR